MKRELLSGLGRLAFADSARTARWAGYAVLIFTAALALLLLWIGPCPQVVFGHDIVVFYSTVWKMLWGIRPHVDFNCTHGLLNFAFPLVGSWITGVNDYCITTGHVLFVVFTSVTCWFVLRLRTTPFVTAVYALYTILTAAGMNALRFDYWELSYGGLYNRQGYTLLLILMALVFLPRRSASAAIIRIDGVILGIVLGCLFFLKITYFLAGTGLLLFGILTRKFSLPDLYSAPAGFLCIFLPAVLYLKGDVGAYLRDLSQAGAVRGTLITPELIVEYTGAIAVPAVLLLLLFLLIHGKSIHLISPALFIGLTAGISLCILLTNAPLGSINHTPLLGGSALLLIQAANAKSAGEAWKHTLAILGGIALAVPFAYTCIASILTAAAEKLQMERTEMIHSPRFTHLQIRDFGGDPPGPFSYVQKINDGLLLLDKFAKPGSRIETLDFVNIFPFASNRPPTRATLSWQLGYSFDEKHHPVASQAFGDPDILLLPRYPSDPPTTESLLRIYAGYLEEHFERQGESPCWILFAKRKR